MDLFIKTTHDMLDSIIDTMSELDIIAESHVIKNGDIEKDIIITFGALYEDIEKDIIITSGALYVLEDLGISVIEGVYCNYNEADGTYEPDFSVSLIYATTSMDTIDYNEYIYWEQDPPLTAIHNYLTLIQNK